MHCQVDRSRKPGCWLAAVLQHLSIFLCGPNSGRGRAHGGFEIGGGVERPARGGRAGSFRGEGKGGRAQSDAGQRDRGMQSSDLCSSRRSTLLAVLCIKYQDCEAAHTRKPVVFWSEAWSKRRHVTAWVVWCPAPAGICRCNPPTLASSTANTLVLWLPTRCAAPTFLSRLSPLRSPLLVSTSVETL